MSESQSFSQWQQSPIQGAIPRPSPLAPADESYLVEVFTECHTKLTEALKAAQGYSRLPDLEVGISDALQGLADASEVLSQPQTYLE